MYWYALYINEDRSNGPRHSCKNVDLPSVPRVPSMNNRGAVVPPVCQISWKVTWHSAAATAAQSSEYNVKQWQSPKSQQSLKQNVWNGPCPLASAWTGPLGIHCLALQLQTPSTYLTFSQTLGEPEGTVTRATQDDFLHEVQAVDFFWTTWRVPNIHGTF